MTADNDNTGLALLLGAALVLSLILVAFVPGFAAVNNP